MSVTGTARRTYHTIQLYPRPPALRETHDQTVVVAPGARSRDVANAWLRRRNHKRSDWSVLPVAAACELSRVRHIRLRRQPQVPRQSSSLRGVWCRLQLLPGAALSTCYSLAATAASARTATSAATQTPTITTSADNQPLLPGYKLLAVSVFRHTRFVVPCLRPAVCSLRSPSREAFVL